MYFTKYDMTDAFAHNTHGTGGRPFNTSGIWELPPTYIQRLIKYTVRQGTVIRKIFTPMLEQRYGLLVPARPRQSRSKKPVFGREARVTARVNTFHAVVSNQVWAMLRSS